MNHTISIEVPDWMAPWLLQLIQLITDERVLGGDPNAAVAIAVAGVGGHQAKEQKQ